MLALIGLALVWVGPKFGAPVAWTPDGLFYQAQVYEVEGQSQATALHRVFTSEMALSIPDPRLRSTAWIKYSVQNYRRRWLVPLAAAALSPLAGTRGLLYASLFAYVVTGPLLFALLRKRFPDAISLITAAVCICLPPLRIWAGYPLTDSGGLAVEICALIAALLALERGGAWIILWTASMLAVAFTRDATLVLLAGVGWIAVATRTRRSAAVLLTGIAASAPAPLLFGAPLVQQLAYDLQGFHVPRDPTWSYVVAHAPAAIWLMLRQDARYPSELESHPVLWYAAGAILILSVASMVVLSPRRDPFFRLHRAAIIGAAVVVALGVGYTGMRLELVFIPSVAVALAFTLQRLRTSAPICAFTRGVAERLVDVAADRFA